ncbi:MAG: type VI secretion system-associated FHA domain protein TagH [Thalassolituus oleivorans]|nr:type VI secretion system-associated FHA domain protein TagH [Thalassolituus oleivorans]
MDLILTVVKCPSHANMLNHTKVFRGVGGRIGRADSNDWVLSDTDRILSSQHAEINFNAGQFFVIDHSTNGTFINESQVPLGAGNNHPLVNGDIINCGEYHLKVTLKAPPAAPSLPKDLGAVDFLDSGDKTTFNPASAAKQQVANDAKDLDRWLDPAAPKPSFETDIWGSAASSAPASKAADDPWGVATSPSVNASIMNDTSNVDPLAALDNSQSFGSPKAPSWDDNDDWWKSGSEADNSPVDQQQIRIPSPVVPTPPPLQQPAFSQPSLAFAVPPQPVPTFDDNPFAASSAGVQHEDIDSLLGISSPAASKPMPTPLSVPPVMPSTSAQHQAATTPSYNANELQQLATLLGIDNIQPAQLQTLIPEMSSIINETVTRLIDLLRARTAIKNELRVQHTMIQTTDNNPLKFSATATDALKVMFSKDRSAFMRPTEAIQDSFDDLSDHQVAVLTGMNTAYAAMLNHFNPESLKRYINAGDSLLGNKNAKNWSAFEQYYKSLKSDHETTYNKLFGEEFARSYEKQLAELKNARALKRRS